MALGKRMNLSFAELNELRIRDLIDLADAFFGVEDDTPRQATQSDIDAFYGR